MSWWLSGRGSGGVEIDVEGVERGGGGRNRKSNKTPIVWTRVMVTRKRWAVMRNWMRSSSPRSIDDKRIIRKTFVVRTTDGGWWKEERPERWRDSAVVFVVFFMRGRSDSKRLICETLVVGTIGREVSLRSQVIWVSILLHPPWYRWQPPMTGVFPPPRWSGHIVASGWDHVTIPNRLLPCRARYFHPFSISISLFLHQ